MSILAAVPAGAATGYVQTNLVSDLPAVASHIDANLKNPWGMASGPNSPIWVADNLTGVSTLYSGSGAVQSLVVGIPAPAAPTGIVFNGTSDFTVGPSQPAVFLFSAENGTISGWNPAAAPTSALVEVSIQSANYKGLAIGNNGSGNFLYATNFSAATIDVFDATFTQATLAGSFTDPNLPAGFAPFGIENIGGVLFVTYAKVDSGGQDDEPGAGNGYVDRFDTNGNLLSRFASAGVLNSPWGLALAPASFGDLGGALLVGNFGDGRINAFNPATGSPIGTLDDSVGNPIVVPGLWDLHFGNGGNGGLKEELFFTAGIPGPDSLEDHGLFGKLAVVLPSVIEVPTLQPALAGVFAFLLMAGALLTLVRQRT
jgi:uncharacterized protein (TIGR03118 family)